MVRLLVLLFLLALLASLLACGYVAVSGAIRPGPQTVTGLVSVVQFAFVNGSSSITIVTLVNAGTSQTTNFCGDQRLLFPMDQTVSANFTPGTTCDSLISVSVQ